MFLRAIHLRDIRCIEQLKLTFDGGARSVRRWTLLIGENGTGKSTILRAVALALAGSELLPDLLGDPDDWIRADKSSGLIEAVLETKSGKARSVRLELRRGDGIAATCRRNSKGLDWLDSERRLRRDEYFVAGYGASRHRVTDSGAGIARSALGRGTGAVGTLFTSDASLVALQNWAQNLDYRTNGRGLGVIYETLGHMMPNVTFAGIDRTTGRLLFATPDGRVPLDHLSDGYQSVAAWCGDLLFRISEIAPHRKTPTSQRGVLLIDEVDLHLHPTWQRQLRAFLDEAFPNLQIITTTHSPLTAQQSSSGELYGLVRGHKSVPPRLVPFTGSPRDMMVHQVILDPIFGIGTVDSWRVQQMRHEFAGLSRTPHLSVANARRKKELAEKLLDLPDWATGSAEEKTQTELLKRIAADLAPKTRPQRKAPVTGRPARRVAKASKPS